MLFVRGREGGPFLIVSLFPRIIPNTTKIEGNSLLM